MVKLEWKEKFSVNVVEMDNHHKKLLSYLNELEDELQAGDSTQKVRDTLNALADYTDLHFAEEERLMRSLHHSELPVQLSQHAYFTQEVHEMYRQLEQGILPDRSLVAFLRDWFVNHIVHEDNKYGKVLAQSNPLL